MTPEDPPYPTIHVVVNPASGGDEPMLNIMNDVFHRHGIDWDVSVTKKYGDASAQASEAIARGVSLVAGYGGDGTQHEIANALLKSGASIPMGILPGGTGNGFAREMGIPKKLADAVELMCTSRKLRRIDAATVNDQFFIQRMYVGIEPEEQTSRELKDKYGVMAYAVSIAKRSRNPTTVHYKVVVDGDAVEFDAAKAYVVNSGMMGTGLQITQKYSIDDGLLDAYFLDRSNLDTLYAAGDRFLHLSTSIADKYYRQFRELTLETDPDQAVWSDGEYVGRTPVTVRVLPGALPIVVG